MQDITVAAMRQEAALATTLDHFGDEWFVGPLTAWTEDLKQQTLSFGKSKLAALSSFTEAEPNRVLHVGYPRLMSDPAATVEAVLSTVEVSGPDMADRVEAFLAAQRSGARVAPPRELARMGYEHEEVLADPVIADYCQRFGIEPERSRLTGAQPPL